MIVIVDVITNILIEHVCFIFLKLRKIFMKCCDVSNEVRPKKVAEPWVDCLFEEYFRQSDKEKQEGLPVAPFMDREKTTKAESQICFIQNILIPMFGEVAQVCCNIHINRE